MDMETGDKFAKKERYFSQEQHEMLKSSLSCPEKLDLSLEDKGSSIRLDEPCSALFEHKTPNADKMLR